MFRWVCIICSLIALVVLGIAGFANGAAISQCEGDPIIPPLPPQCVLFFNVSTWALLLGSGLTVALLGVHLMVAAKKRTWRWFIALLGWPPLSFACYAFFYLQYLGVVASLVFIPLIGLPNLLFSIRALKPGPEVSDALPSADVLSS